MTDHDTSPGTERAAKCLLCPAPATTGRGLCVYCHYRAWTEPIEFMQPVKKEEIK